MSRTLRAAELTWGSLGLTRSTLGAHSKLKRQAWAKIEQSEMLCALKGVTRSPRLPGASRVAAPFRS